MKKEILEKLGIPEDKWKEVRDEYWADVQKVVNRTIRKQEKKQTDAVTEDLKSAILSMVKLINEPVRLQKILAAANNQYYKMCVDQDAEREQQLVSKAMSEEGGGS